MWKWWLISYVAESSFFIFTFQVSNKTILSFNYWINFLLKWLYHAWIASVFVWEVSVFPLSFDIWFCNCTDSVVFFVFHFATLEFKSVHDDGYSRMALNLIPSFLFKHLSSKIIFLDCVSNGTIKHTIIKRFA